MGLITLQDLQTTFKASGVYTIYQDNTVQPQIQVSSKLRLIPGFSKHGLFNRPSYIKKGDIAGFENIYGTLDQSLERQGSFFHRSCEIALAESDILALNLLALDNTVDLETGLPTVDADVVKYQSFSLDVAETNGIPRDELYSSYYNKQRFWIPDKNYLLATRNDADANKLFNLVNLSQTPCTFIITKSAVGGFDIPVNEWYVDNIPSYLNPTDLISDYFIDVICINGNFGPDNYQQLSTDPIYGQFFDVNGLIKNKLQAFLSSPQVSVRTIFTGCLIHGFKDKNNAKRYIEDIINNSITRFNIMCAIDKKQLDAYDTNTNTKFLDLVGHRLITQMVTSIDFLSYKKKISQDLLLIRKTSNSTGTFTDAFGMTVTDNVGSITVVVTNDNADFDTLTTDLKLGVLFNGITTDIGLTNGITVENPVLEIVRILKTDSQISFTVSSPLKDGETQTSGVFVDFDTNDIGSAILQYTYEKTNSRFYLNGTSTYFVADKGSDIYQDYKNGILTNGDFISNGTPQYAEFVEMYASGGIDTSDDFRKILVVNLFTDSELTIPIDTGTAIDFATSIDSNGYLISTDDTIDVISSGGTMDQRFDAIQLAVNRARVDISNESKIKVGHYIVGYLPDGITPMLSRISSIKRFGGLTPTAIDITTTSNIKFFSAVDGTVQIQRNIPIEDYIDRLNLTCLPGFSLKSSHLPNGSNERMYEILNVMFDTNLATAIADPEMIAFRYMIDTFNGGLETVSKAKWTNLAMKRQKCLAILNTPSFQQFIESTDPRFTDTPTSSNPVPELNISYIASGGNLDENPQFQYSLPQNDNGGDYAGFFSPNLIFIDEVEGQISVPPAALVSNNFVRKFVNGGNPFMPVAGLKRGVLTANGLIGVEYALDQTQRGLLEGLGINPIYKKSDGTILIFGNETPYQRFTSALNNLHIRDLLITVTEDMESILFGYVWEYDDPSVRVEINSLLGNYLTGLQTNYKCIQSYKIIFDSTNNPEAFITENAGIVDVQVEPTYAFAKFINRITLTKNSIASSGFVAV